ncbi:hypothetical protein [Hydrogenophaga pseudoflava]|nr:hypothetical protein [Hydrogenophaga pseudoflava]
MKSYLTLCVILAGCAFGIGWQGYRLERARELHWVSKRNEREYDRRGIALAACGLLLALGFRVIEWLSGPLDITNIQSYMAITVFVLALLFGTFLSKGTYVDNLDRPYGWRNTASSPRP